jgi:adenylate kinase family enzyme
MIIGLIGFKQVGKSTAAKYLEEKYGFTRHNMKDALIAEIKQNFPDLLQEIATASGYEKPFGYQDKPHFVAVIDDLFQTKPPLMRALLQNYGTEVRRGDKNSYWTDQWVKKINQLKVMRMCWKFVTDDVRFLNEAKAVKENGGILIRLTRADITTGGTHASETEQLEIQADHSIECKAGDHEHLYRELDRIVNELK